MPTPLDYQSPQPRRPSAMWRMIIFAFVMMTLFIMMATEAIHSRDRSAPLPNPNESRSR